MYPTAIVPNSRFSRATQPDTITEAIPKSDTPVGIRLTISDAGSTTNPSELLSSAESGWDKVSASYEDPACLAVYAPPQLSSITSSRPSAAPGRPSVLTRDCLLGRQSAEVDPLEVR